MGQGANGHVRGVRGGLSVVVSTYEWPGALDAVLHSLSGQSDPDFDVVVADDGSGPETAAVVDRWRPTFGARLEHAWHPHVGCRQALARNRGALTARGAYLVFLDGDVVPRRHFVRALRSSARPGWFVAGRKLELSAALTGRVVSEREPIHQRSLFGWLRVRADATPLSALSSRDRRRVGRLRVPEFEPHHRAYGFLLGVSRRDFERVNGFDARYVGWGEEDVDLALRLRRLGLRCGHAGPQAVVLHLWHPSREKSHRENWWLLRDTERSDRLEAVDGLCELVATPEPVADRLSAAY